MMYDINGYQIPTDGEGRVNLTEIWKWAGRPKSRTPSEFKRRKRVREIIDMANWLAKRGGRSAATWAHHFVAKLYADYVGLDRVQPEQPAADREWAEINRKLDELKAAREQAAREQEAMRDQDDEQARVFSGEGWKEEYDPDTAGEEWKQGNYDADAAGEEWKGEPEPKPEPYYAPGTIFVKGRERKGPDGLFFEYVNIPGFMEIPGCCN